MIPFIHTLIIPPGMIDELGHVNYKRYMDIAEAAHVALLAGRGLSLARMKEEKYALHISQYDVRIRKPLFEGNQIQIEVNVRLERSRELRFEVTIRKEVLIATVLYHAHILKDGRVSMVSNTPFATLVG